MAITNYSELQNAVSNWLAKDSLNARIPEFIALAEAEINRKLRVHDMQTVAQSTASEDDARISVPQRFGGVTKIEIKGSPDRKLEYRTPQFIERRSSETKAKPEFYTIQGNEFVVWPTPDTDYTVEITYYKKVPALTSSNTSNWLLDDHPDVYLYGSLVQATDFLMDDPRAGKWDAKFKGGLQEIQNQDRFHRYPEDELEMKTRFDTRGRATKNLRS